MSLIKIQLKAILLSLLQVSVRSGTCTECSNRALSSCSVFDLSACARSNGQELDLSSSSLYGTIPSNFFVDLRGDVINWNLANNALTGTIPSSISTLAPDPGYAAPTINLAYNQLTGGFPDFVGVNNMNWDLTGNLLRGMLPTRFCLSSSTRTTVCKMQQSNADKRNGTCYPPTCMPNTCGLTTECTITPKMWTPTAVLSTTFSTIIFAIFCTCLFCYCCCCQDKMFSGLPKPGTVTSCCSANPYASNSMMTKYGTESASGPKCRICNRTERAQNCCAPASDKEMLAPCNCSGDKKFVHRGCLNMERALRKDAFAQCPECKFYYNWQQVPSQVSGCRRHSVACKAWCLVTRDVLILFSGVALCMTILGLLVFGMDGGTANIVDADLHPAPFYEKPRAVCYLKNPILDKYLPTAETCPSTGQYGVGWFITYFPCTTWFQTPCHPAAFYTAAGACLFFVFMGLYGGCCFKNCNKVRESDDYGHGMYTHYTYWYFPYYYYSPGYYGYYHSPGYHSTGVVYSSGCGGCSGGDGGGDCLCGAMGSCGDGGGEAGAIIAIILLVVLIIMVIVGIVMGTIILIIFIRTFGKYHATALRKQEQARIWVVGSSKPTFQQMAAMNEAEGFNGEVVATANAVPIAEAVEVTVNVPTAHYVQPNEQDKVVLATIVAW